MIGCVLVSHGGLGQALLETATEIVGSISPVVALSVSRHESLERIRGRLGEAVAEVDCGHGVVILADMFGGTAANVALQLPREHVYEVVTGVNLPMVLKLAGVQAKSTDVAALAQLLKYYGQRNVMVASEALEGRSS